MTSKESGHVLGGGRQLALHSNAGCTECPNAALLSSEHGVDGVGRGGECLQESTYLHHRGTLWFGVDGNASANTRFMNRSAALSEIRMRCEVRWQ